MKNNILVSIILPVYNGAEYLEESLESILGQTYHDFELIIVNDCSTDQSASIIDVFKNKDNRIQVIHNSENQKLPKSLNIGHRAARGDYITWISHDNIFKPFFLESLLKHIIKHDISIVYSNYDVIDKEGEFIRYHNTGSSSLLFGNTIGASFLYKKEVFLSLNGYDETFFLVEDYDFWLQASLRFSFYHLPENLYEYRLQEKSLTKAIHTTYKSANLHNDNLKKMFTKLSKQLQWRKETLDFVLSKHLNLGIDFNTYFKNHKIIKEDIGLFSRNEKDKFIIYNSLYMYLRKEVLKNKKHQNFNTFILFLKKEHQVFFNPIFSKKKTIKLILKCLF